MAWTATLREAKLTAGQWDISVIYSDGVNQVVKGYNLSSVSDATIKEVARNEVDRITALESAAVTIANGSLIDLTPPAPQPPPAPNPARDAFFVTYRELVKYLKLVDMGIITATDSRVTTRRATCKAGWLDAYLDGI